MRCRKMVLRFIKIRMEYSQKQDALSMLNAQKRKLFVLSRFLNCIRLVRFGGGAFLSDVFFRAEHLKMQFYAGNKRKQMVLDDASFTVEQGEAVGIV